jgi:hypothetical protein
MATATSTFKRDGVKKSGIVTPDKAQRRRDRIAAVVVFVVFAALVALIIWQSTLGNGMPIEETWPVMP